MQFPGHVQLSTGLGEVNILATGKVKRLLRPGAKRAPSEEACETGQTTSKYLLEDQADTRRVVSAPFRISPRPNQIKPIPK